MHHAIEILKLIKFSCYSKMEGDSKPGTSQQAITESDVENGIAYGNFKAELDKKSTALAADVMQKIYKKIVCDGQTAWILVNNFHRCVRCDKIVETKPGNGTQPLIRHKEVSCKKLSKDEKTAFELQRVKRLNEKAEQKVKQNLKQAESKTENKGESTSNEPNKVENEQSTTDCSLLTEANGKSANSSFHDAIESAAKIANIPAASLASALGHLASNNTEIMTNVKGGSENDREQLPPPEAESGSDFVINPVVASLLSQIGYIAILFGPIPQTPLENLTFSTNDPER